MRGEDEDGGGGPRPCAVLGLASGPVSSFPASRHRFCVIDAMARTRRRERVSSLTTVGPSGLPARAGSHPGAEARVWPGDRFWMSNSIDCASNCDHRFVFA